MHDISYTFFEKTDWVPRYWYLHECLLWMSLYKIPYGRLSSEQYVEKSDFDRDVNVGPELSKSSLMHLDRKYTDEAKISPSPMYGAFENTHVDELIDTIAELMRWKNDQTIYDPSVKKAGESYHDQRIEEIETFLYEREQWIDELDRFLDVSKTKLFLALHEGKIDAYGIKLPAPDLASAKRYIQKHSARFSLERKVKINSDEWTLSNVNWNDCTLAIEGNFYCCVGLYFNDVMQLYPPKFNRAVNGGYLHDLIISGTDENPPNTESSPDDKQKGRPAKSWDEFHIEVTRQIMRKTLPKKQGAAALEFQIWFKNHLDEDVGISTIAAKLKPYYDEFIK